MNREYSFYSLSDGAIDRGWKLLSLEDLEANTPAGHAPLEGRFDHRSQRVDLATGQVIDWQPPAPADTDVATHRWDAGLRRWVAEPTVEGLRRARWEAIKAHRDSLETDSTFQALGSVFDSDPTRIGGAVTGASVALSASLPFSLVWTLADNTSRTLSAAEMVQVGLAQLAHIDSLHATARQLRAALAAAGTAAEVEAVAWPGNNPGNESQTGGTGSSTRAAGS